MSPLSLLAALPFVALLVLGRANGRRHLLQVAIGAVVATVAFGALYLFPVLGAVPEELAHAVATILTLASWVLLLYGAAESGRGGWFVAVALALALTLGLPLVASLRLGTALHTVLLALSPVVALLLAYTLPESPRAAGPVI